MNKVLFYCKHFFPMHNGYANAYKNLISTLSNDAEYSITVLTTTELGEQPEMNLKNVEIIREKITSKTRYIKYFLTIKQVAKKITSLYEKNTYDMVFIESGDEPLIVPFLPKEIVDKLVIRYHSTSDTEYTTFFPGVLNRLNFYLQKKIIAKRLTNFCSTNNYHLSFVKDHFLCSNEYQISKKRFFTLPNTLGKVDDLFFDNSNKREKKIFILGRMNIEGYYQKGFSDILDVLKNIQPDELNGYTITILGDGAFYADVELMLSKLLISDGVKLVRRMTHEEVLSELKSSTFVILPSRFEGHSMFALEAIACGCVPIFSDAGPLPEMVYDQTTVFNKQDTFELKKILIDSVQKDDLTLKQLSDNSISIYKELYSPAEVKSRFDFMFNSLK